MSMPMSHDEVPAGGEGVDASTLPESHVEGHRVGSLLGLLVGSGVPPTATVTPPPLDPADQFTVTKPFNADQLKDELMAALQRTVLTAFTNVVDGVTPSDTNPVTLWVSPQGLDSFTILNTIANHSPVDDYNTPAANKAFTAILQKIAANETVVLTDDERNKVIVGLALDYLARQTTNIQPSFTPTTSSG